MLVRFPRVVAPVKLAQICGVGHYQSLCLHRERPREGRTDRERERVLESFGLFCFFVCLLCRLLLAFLLRALTDFLPVGWRGVEGG